jgi:hypothetical protein
MDFMWISCGFHVDLISCLVKLPGNNALSGRKLTFLQKIKVGAGETARRIIPAAPIALPIPHFLSL